MEEEPIEPVKTSSAPLLISIAIASLLGAASFVFVFSNFSSFDVPSQAASEDSEKMLDDDSEMVFLPLEPLVISLGSAASGKSLRFEGYLEINPGVESEITTLMPRITDALNTYLRAIEFSDIEEPTSLLRIRLQMLKRVQLIVGSDKVRDLLVSKFLIG